MKFSYEDLLSGDQIFVSGVGHFKPPLVKDIKPTAGIGSWAYQLYLNILSWNKEDFFKFSRLINPRQAGILSNDAGELGLFDVMTLIPPFRQTLQEALGFFLSEEIRWVEKEHRFCTTGADGKEAGAICRDNFDDVRDMMLQLNYINLEKAPLKHSSKKTAALWERAQKRLKEESQKKAADKTFSIGNIVSKLCAAQLGYTLLNIFDLTVFQLYDTFFQYGYLRAMDLNEMAFSNHGGDKFNLQDWLKPIIQI